jgi:hypothetical protein
MRSNIDLTAAFSGAPGVGAAGASFRVLAIRETSRRL